MSPADYAVIRLGLNPYPKQVLALEAIGQRLPMAVCAANGTGKTKVILATAILWVMESFSKARAVVTSGSWLQVEEQLFPALRGFKDRFPGWEFLDTEIRAPNGSQCIGFSTNNPGRAEGWHADDAEKHPLMYIIDEGKTVPDGIFSARDRCTRQFDITTSSPGPSSGQFYRAFTRENSLYWTTRIKSSECPHLPEEKRARDLAKYGPNDPIFRSMHEAEFTEDFGKSIFNPGMLAACLESPPPPVDGNFVAFFDFAAGGDENVMAVRRGNRVWIEDYWHERDTVQATRRFIENCKRLGIRPHQCYGDAGGIGIPIIKQFHDEGWYINEVNNGSAPSDPRYANLGSEIWFSSKRLIEKKAVIIPDDPTFFDQACDRHWKYAGGGKLGLESKEEMRRRGVHSPDRADAVFGVLVCGGNIISGPSVEYQMPEPSQGMTSRPVFKARRL